MFGAKYNHLCFSLSLIAENRRSLRSLCSWGKVEVSATHLVSLIRTIECQLCNNGGLWSVLLLILPKRNPYNVNQTGPSTEPCGTSLSCTWRIHDSLYDDLYYLWNDSYSFSKRPFLSIFIPSCNPLQHQPLVCELLFWSCEVLILASAILVSQTWSNRTWRSAVWAWLSAWRHC